LTAPGRRTPMPPKVAVGRPLMEVAKLAYTANQPLLLIGHTGVGKSESLKQAAVEMKIDAKVIDLSLKERVDLAGMPYRQTEEGREVTRFAPPSELPNAGKGLLVFEELNRAPREVIAPCLQLLTDRRFNDYVLPPGYLPVAAINPPDDGDYQVAELDVALMARFLVVTVEPCAREWVRWAAANGVYPLVIEFVASTPKIFDAERSNPRSWTYVSDILYQCELGHFARATLTVAVCGLVDEKLGRAFLKMYKHAGGTGIPAVTQLLAAYPKHEKAMKAMVAAGDTARLNSVAHQLLLHLQEPSVEAHIKDDAKTLENLRRLVADLPADLRRRVRKEKDWIPNGKAGRPRKKKKAGAKRRGQR